MKKWIETLSQDEKKEYLFPVLYHLIEEPKKQEGEITTLSVKKISIRVLNATFTMAHNFYKPISKI
jgi:hypothetical protein